MTTPSEESSPAKGQKTKLGFRAASAIVASAMPGAVNYFIILLLTFAATPSDVGVYRLIFSYIALANLLTIYESNKVYVRASVKGDSVAATAVLSGQITAAALILIVSMIAVFVDQGLGLDMVPDEIIVTAFLSALYMPTLGYISILQAQGRFKQLFITEVMKYSTALLAFLIVLHFQNSVKYAMYAQYGVMAFWNLVLFMRYGASLIQFNTLVKRPLSLLRSGPAADARMLSLGTLLPATLDHFDKILLSATHGLAALGIYVLGFSTGRFLYSALKPAIYVFYRNFVERTPGQSTIFKVMVAFTAFGAVLAGVFLTMLHFIPGMEAFRPAASVTVILFLSYGVAMADAVYVQAFAINPNNKPHLILIANTSASVLCIFLFIAAVQFRTEIAIILLAIHYPIRHLTTVLFLGFLAKTFGNREISSEPDHQPNPVPVSPKDQNDPMRPS